MLSRRVLTLAASIAIIGANSLVLSPIASSVSASLPDADAAGVMKAAAVYGFATAASALLLAPSIDRLGAARALLFALYALIAALAMSTCASSLLVLCLGQALAGAGAGCALPAIYALSAQVAAKGRESETLGVVLTGWTVSLVVGVSLSAIIAEYAHWRYVFAGLAAGAAVLSLEVRRSREWPPSVSPLHPTSPLTALRVRGIGPALLLVAFYMTAFYGLYSYLGVHLTGVLRLSTAAAGLAPLAYGIGFGIAAFADRLLDRFGAAVAAPLTFLGLGLIYLALAAASTRPTILITLCLGWGLANHVGLNLIVGRLSALDPAQRGAVMGLYSAVTYLTVSIGTLMYRPIFEHLGLTGCALASATCIVPALVLSVIEARRRTGDVVAMKAAQFPPVRLDG